MTNVFVTGVGRCGSVSFREACCHITNYQNGHETLAGRLEYADNFIEVNPHLRACIRALVNKYPDAKFVHLIRRPEDCIPSLAALDHGAVMQAYQKLHPSVIPSASIQDVAYRYYWSENDIITAQFEAFVQPENRMEVRLDFIEEDWPIFWKFIEAKGDYKASLESWKTPKNTRAERGEPI